MRHIIDSAEQLGNYIFLISCLAALRGPVVICLLGLGWLISAKMNRPIAFSFRRLTLLLTGIGYPLLIFFLSALLTPEAKSSCRFGWLDCFELGKLALTPLIVWACVAFYMAQISKRDVVPRKWIVSGLFMGAIVSGICLVWDLLRLHPMEGVHWWLLVPFYVCVWYSALFILFVRKVEFKTIDYVKTLLFSTPFWIISGFWSYQKYRSLPSEYSGCFVVTAASHGHSNIVGPFTEIERRGEMRMVNQQLLTFWRFEALWQKRFPKTHQNFRFVYNRLGPRIARLIQNKVLADMVYLLLKPFEAVAGFILKQHELIRN